MKTKTNILPEGKDLADMTRAEVLEFLSYKTEVGLINLVLAILGHDSESGKALWGQSIRESGEIIRYKRYE